MNRTILANIVILQATIAILCSSCTTLVPYTSAVQTKYKLTDKDIYGIQFYLSDEVTLYRASDDGQASANNGGLIVHSDRQTEEVILRKGTPGIVEDVYADRLVVSFEIGQGKYLIFGNSDPGGPYYLMAEEWERRHGKLSYAGKTYFAKPGSGTAFLKMKLRKLRQLEKRTRIASGRRL